MPEGPKFSAKRALVPSEISSRPWQTVSAGLFYAQQSWVLIVFDHYAKFPFVRKLSNLTIGAVVKEIKTIFAENGIPETLQCDNGTQFTSVEFHQLAIWLRDYNVIHPLTIHDWRGHGFVDRQVQTVKRSILKCLETREDKSSPAGTPNNTPESQYTKHRRLNSTVVEGKSSGKTPRRLWKLAEGETRLPEPFLQQTHHQGTPWIIQEPSHLCTRSREEDMESR